MRSSGGHWYVTLCNKKENDVTVSRAVYSKFAAEIQRTIAKYEMLTTRDRVLAGVSGGASGHSKWQYVLLGVGLVATIAVTILVSRIARNALKKSGAAE